MSDMSLNAKCPLDVAAAEGFALETLGLVVPLRRNSPDRTPISSDAGHSETVELIGRLADRLLRQERLLKEERSRSAALELQLARAQAQKLRAA